MRAPSLLGWVFQVQSSDVIIGWSLLIGAAAFAGIAILLLLAKGKSS